MRVLAMDWKTVCQHFVTCSANGRTLVAFISPVEKQRWQAFVVESYEASIGGTADDAELNAHAERVFDDHSHAVLGVFSTLHKAKSVGEGYARAWKKRHRANGPCGCSTIGKAS